MSRQQELQDQARKLDACRDAVEAATERFSELVEARKEEQGRDSVADAKDFVHRCKHVLSTQPARVHDAFGKLKVQAREAQEAQDRLANAAESAQGSLDAENQRQGAVQEALSAAKQDLAVEQERLQQVTTETKELAKGIQRAKERGAQPQEPTDPASLSIKFMSTASQLRRKLVALNARYEAMLRQPDGENYLQLERNDEKVLMRSVVHAFDGTSAFPAPSETGRTTAVTGDDVVIVAEDAMLDAGGFVPGKLVSSTGDGVATVHVTATGEKHTVPKDAVRRPDGSGFEISGEMERLDSLLSRIGGDQLLQGIRDDLAQKWATAQQRFAELKKEIVSISDYRQEVHSQIQNIMVDQKKMMDWANTQLSKIAAARQSDRPEDMRRMCESLMKNRGVAEQNFAVLLESAQQHLPDPLVDSAMRELAAVWRKLQIAMYEETQGIYTREHKDCDAARVFQEYSGFGKDKVKPFLDDVLALLQSCDSDPASADAVRQCKKECEDLLNNYAPHQLIVEHLADFEVRQDVLGDHYQSLSRTIQSPLTQLCQQLGGNVLAYQDRRKYEQSVESLRMWLSKTAQDPKAWQSVQQKLAHLQALAGA